MNGMNDDDDDDAKQLPLVFRACFNFQPRRPRSLGPSRALRHLRPNPTTHGPMIPLDDTRSYRAGWHRGVPTSLPGAVGEPAGVPDLDRLESESASDWLRRSSYLATGFLLISPYRGTMIACAHPSSNPLVPVHGNADDGVQWRCSGTA